MRAPLEELLDDPLDGVDLERVRRRVQASRRAGATSRPARRRVVLAMAAAIPVALGLGWLALGERPTAPGPLSLASGAPVDSLRGEATFTLSDASTIALGADVEVAVLENTGARVVLAQGEGRAEYGVTPGGPRRWTIDAGAVSVDVIGTRFVVERSPAWVRVSVRRGHVRVRGGAVPGGLAELRASDRIEVPIASGALSVADEVTEPSDAVEPEPPLDERDVGERAPDAPGAPIDSVGTRLAGGTSPGGGQPLLDDPPASPRGVRASSADQSDPRSRWRELASRGEHRAAFELLGERSLRERSEVSRSIDELFALADTARLSGHPDLAVSPLRRIVELHPSDRRAALAALTLGRLSLDVLDAPADAVRELSRARELGLSPHLEELALARLVEAERRAGHVGQARAFAAEYLSRYPSGAYANGVSAMVDPAE
ncbi:MAG: FecR domain-containing protein [Sandaracinaceae bacterium]